MNKLRFALATLIIMSYASINSYASNSHNTKGFSIGPNIGYSTLEQRNNAINIISSNPTSGLHLEYQHPTSEKLFIGAGYSFSHLFGGKENNSLNSQSRKTMWERSYQGINYSQSSLLHSQMLQGGKSYENCVQEDIGYRNPIDTLSQKKNSHYFTVRLGKFIADDVSINANLSMIMSEFNVLNKNIHRVGFGPGIGLTLYIDDKISTSINYMYEVYDHDNNELKPKITIHNFFARISYHI